MTEPQGTVRIGGVTFYKNEVRLTTQEKQPDGKMKYSVFLENGVQIKYPEQAASQRASSNGFGDKDSSFQVFRNIDNAEISGSKRKSDTIELQGCQDCNVDIMDKYDAYDKPKHDHVMFKNNDGRISQGNKVFSDKYDTIDNRGY